MLDAETDIASEALQAAVAGSGAAAKAVAECEGALVKAALPADEASQLAAEPSPQAYKEFLTSVKQNVALGVANGQVTQCLGAAVGSGSRNVSTVYAIIRLFFGKAVQQGSEALLKVSHGLDPLWYTPDS